MAYMLEKLFKSHATVKILNLLFFSKPLHIRDIARRTGITPIYVKKELETIGKLGLVLNTRVGNLSIWEINKRSPIAEDLKRIFLKTEGLGARLASIFKKFSVKYALIYGSFAKGTEKPDSDIDVLVIGDVDYDELARAMAKAEDELGREINYIQWSEKDFKKKARQHHHLLIDIARHPIIWIKGDEHGFRKALA